MKFLADLAARERRDCEAAILYRASLILNRDIGRQTFMTGCLAGLAVLAERRFQLDAAARLAGFVDTHRGPVRLYAKAIDHTLYEKTALSTYDRKEERAEGQKMSLDEAVDYALRISIAWELPAR